MRTLLLTLCVMLLVGSAHAAYEVGSGEWDGLSELVQLAKAEAGATNVVATQSLDYAALAPQDAVILLHPETSLDIEALSRFLRDGGRVVLFDDGPASGGSGDELLRYFHITRVPLPTHPALELRHNPALAIAEPSDHQTAHNVSRVVLNHATGIEHADLSPLLFVRADDGSKTFVGLAGAVEKGHLLVVSDASVPINSMLRFPGNKAFTRNVLHYAYAGVGDVTQTGKLYIVTGGFEQVGTYGAESEGLGKLRLLSDAFRAIERDGLPPAGAYMLAALAALALVLWAWSRATHIHRSVTPRYVKATPVAAQGGIAGHAALIAAPHTTRALAILEIKAALEERICLALDTDRAPAPDEVVRQARQKKLLSDESGRKLRALLAYMSEVETLVMSRQRDAMRRLRDVDVLRCSEQARALAREMS